ncbi:hypothetical protein BYT27DRAFT_7256162 [Phlegmacium glaucopus]|nr:hypothetical protein BYT27DRAFT_7256162 [Phlegmacium glaucopus]
MPWPDPSHYPEPYPFRPPLHHSPPPLSSAGSSSTSTRSSAYAISTNTLPYSDYNNVHIASGDEDSHQALGINPESLVQMLANDPATSFSRRPFRSPDPSRWSESYSNSIRSRSSSLGNGITSNGAHEVSPPPPLPPSLNPKPSYDVSWQAVVEKDDIGMSEEETDDEHGLIADSVNDPDLGEKHEERTSAAVVAEEGRGLIIQGDNVPIVQLQVQPGTTHLLIGSSSTPNAIPAFLTSSLPQISYSLLALDISANFLGALPPVLADCENLEELNVASNPLRVLPVFLADLINLRVLIADSTGISTLPETLADLDKLHTLSVRRNKLHALPSWLCLLPALQTLCVDGNPFQGPWKALVEPLLAKVATTPVYPPTPVLPLSAGALSTTDTENDTDTDDLSDHDAASPGLSSYITCPEEEDHTITPARAPLLGRSITAPLPLAEFITPVTQSKPLVRTRTTPNRTYFDQARGTSIAVPSDLVGRSVPIENRAEGPESSGEREIRKMKSAGDLRRGRSANAVYASDEMPSPALSHYPTSISSSNLLNMGGGEVIPDQTYNKRFASLGPNSQLIPPSRPSVNAARPQLSQSMWDSTGDASNNAVNRTSFSPSTHVSSQKSTKSDSSDSRQRPTREKSSRWGFLKKMSMGRIKPDAPLPSPTGSPSSNRTGTVSRSHKSGDLSGSISRRTFDRTSKSPQIDVRLSTTGKLDAHPILSSPSLEPVLKEPLQASPVVASPSSSLVIPPLLHTRSKRRSFLPVEAPGVMSLSIPENSAFVTGVMLSQEGENPESQLVTPNPVPDHEQYIRRQEDRARDAYTRALRSVMAYLKDMNDLGTVQQGNPLSVYGSSTTPDDHLTLRSRRPTVVEASREVSMTSSASTVVSLSEMSAQLRSSDSITGLRSGASSQTLSVATTDSNGSSDERKFKDDKGKRVKVIQEILKTERTYVAGLQELVDIYIKPSAVPVNLLSGVGSSKDTIVPSSERKIVFGGVDALFSFHKDSFLPALEGAAAPLMNSSMGPEADLDGQLSIDVAKAVGNMFVKHAAFMKMYSSYINNFDNSMHRISYWSSDRSMPGSSPSIPPSSSTAQLVGLGITMAITNPNAITENAIATGVPNLSTGQRKRIKAYLKRCRLNPRHTQLNLEGYLLLPVQRIPRYKLMLEELLRSTPPTYEYMDDPLDRALAEIALLANNMNEGKRESESRRKLVQWQSRIRGKFPSPLVQPHRRLIMDGPLLLTRVVRKAVVSFEAINAQGDASTVQVDCLAPELTPRPLIGILCNDLLVLCRDPSEGQDPASHVDLWAVLRMQTLPQPASIVHGNALRLVDNKAILYFDAPSSSDALNWYRAINLHIPASKA